MPVPAADQQLGGYEPGVDQVLARRQAQPDQGLLDGLILAKLSWAAI